MSNTVDERIVEMRFNNQQFEKNAQTSIKTLEELKKSLKLENAVKGFQDIEKASAKVDMSGLSDNVQKVADRFSFLGIAADQVIRRITDQVIGLTSRFTGLIKSMTFDPIITGYSKYEQKTQNVQTLINSTGDSIEDVNGYLEKLMWYSDETSFGFTDMTSALSTMSAAGGDVQKLIPMLMGIGNAVAFAGKGAAEFQRTVFNLNQSYSGGFLNSRDWYSLQQAGVNSKQLVQELIRAGEELGKIQKGTITEANFTSTLADRWADTEVMERAFGYFAEMTEKAYELVNNGDFDTATEAYRFLATQYDTVAMKAAKSAQEAKSFNEVIEATKDAVSSKWMRIYENIFGNYEEQKVMWSNMAEDFYTIFADGLDGTADLLSGVFGGSPAWDTLTTRIEEAGLSLDDFEGVLSQVGNSVAVKKLTDEYGSLTNALKSGDHYAKVLAERGLKGLVDGALLGQKETVNLEDKLVEIQDIADKVLRGELGAGEERRKILEEMGYDYDYIQEMAAKSHNGNRLTLEDVKMFEGEIGDLTELTDEQREALKKLVDGTDDANESLEELLKNLTKKSGRELLSESISSILKSVIQIKDVFGDAFDSVFGDSEARGKRLYNLLERFHEFTSQLSLSDKAAASLKSTFSGLMSIFKFFGVTAKNVFRIISPLFSIFKTAGRGLFGMSGNLGDVITKFVDWYENSELVQAAVDKLNGYVQNFSDFISEHLGPVFDKINEKLPKTREEFEKLFDTFKKSRVGQFVGSIVTKIQSWFAKIPSLDNEKIQSIITGVSNALQIVWAEIKKVYNVIKTFLAPYLDQARIAFSGFLSKVEETISGWIAFLQELEEGEGIFNYLVRKIQELWTTISQFVSNGGLSQLFSGFLEKLKPIKEHFDQFLSDLYVRLEHVDWSKVLAFALGLSVIPIFVTLSSMFKQASNLFKASKNLINNVNSLLSKMKKEINSPIMEIAKAVALFAVAIGILAGSLWVIAQIPHEKLKESATVLGIMVGVMAALAVGIGLLAPKISGFYQIALGILAFSGAIALLTGSLWVLQNVKITWKNLGALIFIMAALVGAITLLSLAAPKLEKVGWVFLTFSAAIFVLVSALEKIANIPGDKLEGSFEVLAALMLALAAAGIAASVTKGAGFGLLGATVALLLLLKFADKLADDKVRANVEKAISNWQLLWKLFAGVAAMALLARIGGKGAAKTGIAIALISASLLIIYKALSLFGGMDKKVLGQGIGAVSIIFGLFTLFAAFARVGLGNPAKIGKAIAAMSASLLIVYFAMRWIGNLDDKQYVKGLFAIIVILGLFAIISKILGEANGNAKTGPIIAMALALGVIAAAIAFLSLYSWGDLLKSTLAITAVLLAFGKSLQFVSNANFDNFNKKAIFSYIAVLGALGAISYVLYKLAEKDWASMLSAAGSISAVLLAMAFAMKIMSKETADFDLAQGAAFAAGLVGVWFIGEILGKLAEKDWASMLSAAGSISAVLLAVATAMRIASKIPDLGSAGTAIVSILLGIIGIGALVFGLGWLIDLLDEKGFGASGKLEKGIQTMTQIGEAIGGFVGGIVGGGLDAMMSHLPAIGTYLSDFIENSMGFFDGINKIDPSAGAALSSVIGALSGLVLAETFDKFISKLTGESSSLNKLPLQMQLLGLGFKSLAENLPSDDGLAKIEAVGPTLQAFTELASQMDYTDTSLMGKIFGKDDIGTFGEQLKSFGTALKDYGTEVNGLNVNAITSSVQAAKDVGAIGEALPTEGGIISLFTGKIAWETISEQLRSFGSAMAAYGLIVNSLKVNAISASVPAATALGQIGDALPTTGGLIRWFSGEVGWDTVSSNLAKFGLALRAYSVLAAGIDSAAVSNSIQPSRDIATITEILPQATRKGLFTKTSDTIATFKTNLIAYGEALVEYSNTLANVNTMAIDNVPELQVAGENVGKAIADGAENQKPAVTAAISSLLSAAITMANAKKYSFISAGGNLSLGIAQGIEEQRGWPMNAIERLAEDLKRKFEEKTKIESPSKVFAAVARYIPMGIARGITDNASYATTAVEDVGDMMISAMTPAMAILSELMNGDVEFDPTIRPVLDMSDVNSQAGAISSLFGAESIGVKLGATVSGSVNDYRDYAHNQATNYSGEIGRLIALNQQLVDLAKAGGQVYIDGDVIAGTVNSRLGVL